MPKEYYNDVYIQDGPMDMDYVLEEMECNGEIKSAVVFLEEDWDSWTEEVKRDEVSYALVGSIITEIKDMEEMGREEGYVYIRVVLDATEDLVIYREQAEHPS